MNRIPKSKFAVGEIVLINPFGTMGKWTWVDRNLNIKGNATIVSKNYFLPNADSIEVGVKEGYWEYSLKWKDSNHRPKYPLAEKFLFKTTSLAGKRIRQFYKLEKKVKSLVKEIKEIDNEKSLVFNFLFALDRNVSMRNLLDYRDTQIDAKERV